MKLFNIQKLNSAVLKQTAILSLGTLTSQIIALAINIILQRYFYSPEQFGEYNLFLNIATVFASVATLKYEYAVMIADNENKARYLFGVAIASSLLVACLAAFCIFFLNYFNLINLGGKYILILVFLLVFLSGLNDVFNNWFNRSKLYVNMTLARIIQSLFGEGAKLALFFTPLQSIAMQTGRVLGFGCSAMYLFFYKYKDFKSIFSNLETKQLKSYAFNEKKYPLITTPNVLINSLNAAVFSYCIFEYFGAAKLGVVSVAIQYVAVPLGIISSSFGQIYFQNISEINDFKKLRINYLNNVKFLAAIAFIVLVLVFLIPDDAYTFFLGSKWEGISLYFKICIFYMSFSFVSSSVSFIYLKLDKHKLLLYFSITQLLLTFFSLFLPNKFGFGLSTSFICYAVLQAIFYLACIGLGWFLLNKVDE